MVHQERGALRWRQDTQSAVPPLRRKRDREPSRMAIVDEQGEKGEEPGQSDLHCSLWAMQTRRCTPVQLHRQPLPVVAGGIPIDLGPSASLPQWSVPLSR